MNKQEIRMRKIVFRLIDYWKSYPNQSGYTKISDRTLIDDALYGLGIALDKNKYSYAQGYRDFKKVLIEHLQKEQ